ncbi:hypothetical protein BCR44DRAFT_49196 [Catenaria anguillulae PL171]|uniref:Tyrosinase copper-binding domain-containing protein n=1 Tax=Catenaria anguillulae PL171 TaxID=765915 RepID=A0A1Y2HGN7_9FUNG|nr:hypothetical protein BCR44DRAFT_49196 [Catenaria anguillulae PL171]
MTSLLHTLLILALVAASAHTQSCGPLRFRKELRDLTPAELTGMHRAFGELFKKGRIQHYVTMHQSNSDTSHNSPLFLSWHRAMLFQFEKEFVAETGGALSALPYWASTLDAANPAGSPVFSEPYFGSSSGCLAGRYGDWKKRDGSCVRRGLRQGAWMVEPVEAILARASRNSYAEFSSYVEFTGHASVHNGVGGDMANLLNSPWDPLFWMHHNGVDRTWARWQGQSAANAAMYDGTFNGKQVSASDDIMGLPARQVLDHVNGLCYRFAEPGQGRTTPGGGSGSTSSAPSSTSTGSASRPATPTATTSGAADPTATPPATNGNLPPGLTQIPQLAQFDPEFIKSFKIPADRLNATLAATKVATEFANRMLAEGKQLPKLEELKNLNLGPIESILAQAGKAVSGESGNGGASGGAGGKSVAVKSGPVEVGFVAGVVAIAAAVAGMV